MLSAARAHHARAERYAHGLRGLLLLPRVSTTGGVQAFCCQARCNPCLHTLTKRCKRVSATCAMALCRRRRRTCPLYMPSAAMNSSFCSPYRTGSWNVTCTALGSVEQIKSNAADAFAQHASRWEDACSTCATAARHPDAVRAASAPRVTLSRRCKVNKVLVHTLLTKRASGKVLAGTKERSCKASLHRYAVSAVHSAPAGSPRRSPLSPSSLCKVTEMAHPRERRAAPGVVKDLADHALDVAIPLCSVKRPVPRRSFPVRRVRREHAPAPLALGTNHAPHLRTHTPLAAAWSRWSCSMTTRTSALVTESHTAKERIQQLGVKEQQYVIVKYQAARQCLP